MKRAIQRLIQDPLALKILDGEVHAGDEIDGRRRIRSGEAMRFERVRCQSVGAA